MDYSFLSVSDGTGEAVIANIETDRAIASVTLDVDSVDNFPAKFIAAAGTKLVTNYIDPSTMTVFYGHLDGGDIIIDGFAPGYADAGNTDGQIVVIKPNTYWADEIVEMAKVVHEDDGTLKADVVDTDQIADGAVGAEQLSTSAITLGYTEITGSITTTSATYVQATGLTASVTIPAGGRKVKITVFVSQFGGNNTNSSNALSIWDGTVGSGTQLNQATGNTHGTVGDIRRGMVCIAVHTPSAGAKTYNVGYKTSAGTVFLDASATAPAFILVELI